MHSKDIGPGRFGHSLGHSFMFVTTNVPRFLKRFDISPVILPTFSHLFLCFYCVPTSSTFLIEAMLCWPPSTPMDVPMQYKMGREANFEVPNFPTFQIARMQKATNYYIDLVVGKDLPSLVPPK